MISYLPHGKLSSFHLYAGSVVIVILSWASVQIFRRIGSEISSFDDEMTPAVLRPASTGPN